MQELLAKLFEGADLTDEFKERIGAVLDEKVQEIEAEYKQLCEDYKEYVNAEYEEKVEEYIKEEVIPTFDKYLSYVAEKFVEDNKMVIESNAKVELADNFLNGMRMVAEVYDVKISPEESSLIKNLESKVDEANKTISDLLDTKKSLEESVIKLNKAAAINEALASYTDTQREKIVSLSEKIAFTDKEQFIADITEMANTYFPSGGKPAEALDEKTKPSKSSAEKIEDPYLSKLFEHLK